ncbi:MAG: hypothetical protein H6849_04990 [Alphaproteobacteria bacterium]|nr:MAG: hypothetical protein H6849_04990 [Alphaproteobacteria bacterium]
MAKSILLLFVGGVAIYGAIMIDLNLIRESQKTAIIEKSKKPSDAPSKIKDVLGKTISKKKI